MYIKGHTLIKLINSNWVLDITECIGYYIETDKKSRLKTRNEIQKITKAFEIKVTDSDMEIDKYINVPVKVLTEAREQVYRALKESEISNV